MKFHKLAALLAATCIATPAFAEGLEGFRAEARVGWESARASATVPNPDDDEDEDGDEFITVSDSESGISYGLEIGYDALLSDRILIGAYGGVDFSDFERCGELIADDLACVSSGRTFTAGVRAGVALSPSFLLYAKGGYSNGRVEFGYDSDIDEEDELDADVPEVSDNVDGYHLGAGAEIAFTPNLYGKLEYVYTNYGNFRFLGVEDDDEPTVGISPSRHQVMAGIGFRF
ncbi:outer membrane protein [Sphingosinicella terrae]|jgi:outer membrane immunogenic protein|uniref:outer membrane protein n=1 Tax=Sphingosinicella terrae TaxID=2172047 RepID=UPI000E0CFF13|nr:outer membrane beta-barrel protein [Sphingosinicella terrae]